MAKNILIVDDEPDIMELAVRRLKSSGYGVLTVVDAEAAEKLLKTKIPDLILLDILLPGMQGDELCRQLKNDPKLKNIPVILFTASTIRVPERFQECQADDYVMKPFEPEELLGKIKKLIG